MSAPVLPISTHIRIAILPFEVLAEDVRLERFCTGLCMDLSTDLSRFRPLQLVELDDKADWPEQLDYVVKGMARLKKGQLQINVQLIQARENRLVWAERFEDDLEALFQIEENIVRKIVLSLQQSVDQDLLTRMRKQPLQSLHAYELWLRGIQELKKGNREADEQARSWFEQALEIDPHFARAYTGMSLTYFNEWSCLLWENWDATQEAAIKWALKAVELDAYDPVNALILGKCYLFYRQYDQAAYYLAQALEMKPADPGHLCSIAFCQAFLGETELAVELYEQALSLSLTDKLYLTTGSFVYFEAGEFEKALAIGQKLPMKSGWIDFPATMAAAYYQVGDLENMRIAWKAYVDYFHEKIRPGQPIDEATALRWTMEVNPYQKETQHQPFWAYISENLGQPFPVPSGAGLAAPALGEAAQFMQEGHFWTLKYKGEATQMPDLKGLHDLAKLLAQPHAQVHCADLMGLEVVEKGIEVLDDKARRAYHKRLLDIQQDLQEAEALQQLGRIEGLQSEYDQLLEHLSQAVGKGGKTRKVSSSLERARTAATWRIRSAIKKIDAVHPALASHLKVSVRTGLMCSYAPEADIRWVV